MRVASLQFCYFKTAARNLCYIVSQSPFRAPFRVHAERTNQYHELKLVGA